MNRFFQFRVGEVASFNFCSIVWQQQVTPHILLWAVGTPLSGPYCVDASRWYSDTEYPCLVPRDWLGMQSEVEATDGSVPSEDASGDEQLEELRRLCRESGVSSRFSETTFRRFLLGRKRDVAGAHRDLVAFAKWREEHGGDSLTLEDCGDYGRRRVSFLHGRDKRNRPIIVSIAGRHPASRRNFEEVVRLVILLFDEALALAAPEEQIISVFDLSAFGLWNMDLESVKLYLSALQVYYPETLGQLLVVNAPFIFWACWSVIKPLIDPATASKIMFVGIHELEDFIPRDQISSEIGLTMAQLAESPQD